MYQLTLTSTEYPNHTVVNFDLWLFPDDGPRTLERMEHIFIPEPSGALFERSQSEFLTLVHEELGKFLARTVDTRQ